ncbi:MAG: DUF4233 domain-containing protein [Nocardioidaceae bacterium]|nr:MAG: DUF4233 domain-containing protein [Nocardioidaceae bacterium]
MRSMQRSLCAGILSLEAVVLGLTTPVMISVSDVRWQIATVIGVGLLVLCLLVAGMLRARWAYLVGWGIQIAALALGFVIPTMFALGAVFLALWWAAYSVGAKVDADRAQQIAAYEAREQASSDSHDKRGGADPDDTAPGQ